VFGRSEHAFGTVGNAQLAGRNRAPVIGPPWPRARASNLRAWRRRGRALDRGTYSPSPRPHPTVGLVFQRPRGGRSSPCSGAPRLPGAGALPRKSPLWIRGRFLPGGCTALAHDDSVALPLPPGRSLLLLPLLALPAWPRSPPLADPTASSSRRSLAAAHRSTTDTSGRPSPPVRRTGTTGCTFVYGSAAWAAPVGAGNMISDRYFLTGPPLRDRLGAKRSPRRDRRRANTLRVFQNPANTSWRPGRTSTVHAGASDPLQGSWSWTSPSWGPRAGGVDWTPIFTERPRARKPASLLPGVRSQQRLRTTLASGTLRSAVHDGGRRHPGGHPLR